MFHMEKRSRNTLFFFFFFFFYQVQEGETRVDTTGFAVILSFSLTGERGSNEQSDTQGWISLTQCHSEIEVVNGGMCLGQPQYSDKCQLGSALTQ